VRDSGERGATTVVLAATPAWAEEPAPCREFTVEAIFLPFDRDSTPELEFQTNFIWLLDRASPGPAPSALPPRTLELWQLGWRGGRR
jgi:hypothetical protein